MIPAVSAYTQTLRLRDGIGTISGSGESVSAQPASTGGTGFSETLEQEIGRAVESGHAAEGLAAQGLSGHGDMGQIVTAVSNAQLALQTTTVLRDRFVQAYQDVMRMSI